MSAQLDAFGRDVLLRVYPTVMGSEPSAVGIQAVQAVSRGEGLYGRASYRELSIPDGEVVNSTNETNNWGAVQSGKPPCDPNTSFLATDSSPRLRSPENPKGLYQICFRRYATPDEGCANYLHVLLVTRPAVVEAIETGSAQAVAQAMHDTRYFEGFGPTVEDRIANYAAGITKNAAAIAENLGEPLLVTREGSFFGGSGGCNLPGMILAFAIGAGAYYVGSKGGI